MEELERRSKLIQVPVSKTFCKARVVQYPYEGRSWNLLYGYGVYYVVENARLIYENHWDG